MHLPSAARWIPFAFWLAVAPAHAQEAKGPPGPPPVVPVPPAPDTAVVDLIKPNPPTPIPDDPPPHEGAMIDLEYTIEPPDLLLVEVLEALPGRPISGERLVRPDGKVNLGFYGDVYVRGLTTLQAKEKIIFHLRKHLTDDVLGLWRIEDPGPSPEDPGNALPRAPLEPPPDVKERSAKPHTSRLPKRSPSRVVVRNAGRGPVRRTAQTAPAHDRQDGSTRPARPVNPGEAVPRIPVPAPAPGADPALLAPFQAMPPVPPATELPYQRKPRGSAENKLMIPPGQNVKITIEIQGQAAPSYDVPLEQGAPVSPPEAPPRYVLVQPHDSDRVFVDVTAFNSKVYYVQGDVAAPGRMPWTGQETVLDALNYAGGFLPTADQKDVHLVRPPRAGKPARVYAVDYEAILKRGEPKTNYQLFPGDRLVIGRNDVVTKTIEIDRLAMPLQTIFHSLNQLSVMAGSLKYLGNPAANPAVITASQRDAVVKAWAEFWARAMAQPGGVSFDEKVLQDVLMRALNSPAEAAPEKK